MHRSNNNLSSSNLVDDILIKSLILPSVIALLLAEEGYTRILLGASRGRPASSAVLLVPRGSEISVSIASAMISAEERMLTWLLLKEEFSATF